MSQLKNFNEISLNDLVLKIKQVIEVTSLSQATIYRYLKDESSNFPRPIKLGAGRVGWRRSDIIQYITSCPVSNNSDWCEVSNVIPSMVAASRCSKELEKSETPKKKRVLSGASL